MVKGQAPVLEGIFFRRVIDGDHGSPPTRAAGGTKARRAHISTIVTYRRYVVKALVGGRDQEDDESYRYRINLKLQSKGGSAEGDLRLAILQIPGVQDIDFERQAGTYNAYVYGVAPTVPASLLQLVQEQIDQRTAYPLVGLAIAYLGSPSRRQQHASCARGTDPPALSLPGTFYSPAGSSRATLRALPASHPPVPPAPHPSPLPAPMGEQADPARWSRGRNQNACT